jgi:hypothetical protein
MLGPPTASLFPAARHLSGLAIVVRTLRSASVGSVAQAPLRRPGYPHLSVLDRRDGTALAVISRRDMCDPLLEVVLTESAAHLRKRHDPETGLALIRPEL